MLPVQPLPSYRNRNRARGLTRRQLRWMENISLWLAVMLLLLVQPLFAEASEQQVAYGSGQFHFMGEGHRQPAPVLTTDYQVTVTGLIAETRLQQRFGNDSDQWQEGVYTFPLPDNATVHAMILRAGEREIVGEIREREQARQEYETARQEGRQAARVEQQRPNLFTTRLANIPPGEAVTVELHFQQPVAYDSGEFSLRLPATLTPRYIPGVPQTTAQTEWSGGWATATVDVADAHQITPPQVEHHEVAEGSHNMTIAVELRTGIPVAQVASASHQITEVRDGGTVRITPAAGALPMDRDFRLSWQPVRGQEPAAAVFHEQWQGEDYVLAMLVPGDSGREALTRELVLVIDTSGSMGGESIRQAREALLGALDTLSPEDSFNIIQFNSDTRQLFPVSRTATADNLARARHYVRQLEARGGTEMAPAIEAALSAERTEVGRDLRQVVFVTDGAVGNEQALFGQIQQQIGNSRLFTVAIGSAPNMHFMRQAARYGRGTYTTIGNLSEVGHQLATLFQKMQSPALTDIEVAWPDDFDAESQVPERVGDLYLGEPMMLVARGSAPRGELTVSGSLSGGQPWQRTLALDNAGPGSGIHRLWARGQVDHALDQRLAGLPEDSVREQVLSLGLAHGLVTPFTSFVAIDTTPVRPENEALARSAVPSLMPAGSERQRISYPQTATSAPLLMLTGTLGLALAGILALFRRLRRA